MSLITEINAMFHFYFYLHLHFHFFFMFIFLSLLLATFRLNAFYAIIYACVGSSFYGDEYWALFPSELTVCGYDAITVIYINYKKILEKRLLINVYETIQRQQQYHNTIDKARNVFRNHFRPPTDENEIVKRNSLKLFKYSPLRRGQPGYVAVRHNSTVKFERNHACMYIYLLPYNNSKDLENLHRFLISVFNILKIKIFILTDEPLTAIECFKPLNKYKSC